MFYKKTETYRFYFPKEFKAYLAFKDRLKEMGIAFTDEGSHSDAIISIRTNGSFDVDDKCDIWNLVKEDK